MQEFEALKMQKKNKQTKINSHEKKFRFSKPEFPVFEVPESNPLLILAL